MDGIHSPVSWMGFLVDLGKKADRILNIPSEPEKKLNSKPTIKIREDKKKKTETLPNPC